MKVRYIVGGTLFALSALGNLKIITESNKYIKENEESKENKTDKKEG